MLANREIKLQEYSDTFDNFVIGRSNRLAFTAALEAASLEKDRGPLLLCGGSGTGKTHLLHAIANEFQKEHPDKNYILLEMHDFVQNMLDFDRKSETEVSIQKEQMRYDDIDLLLIEDIQYLHGKEFTQQEVANLLRELYEVGKVVVMTCNCLPNQLEGFSPLFLSCVTEGLVIELQNPDYETRAAISYQYNKQQKFEINPYVLEYIAQRVTTNIRELQGMVNKMAAISVLEGRAVTEEDVEQELAANGR